MSSIKVDIVVPSYIKDLKCIVPCLRNLKKQTVTPNNIIVCISEISDNVATQLRQGIRMYLDMPCNVVLLNCTQPQNAAQNRNRGIDYCQKYTHPDFIMFIDCDDVTNIHKIEYFLQALALIPDMVLFLHDYDYDNPSYDAHESFQELTSDDLFICRNVPNCTNLDVANEHINIHHGHPTVRSDVCFVTRYKERMPRNEGEDGDFCQRVNSNNRKVIAVKCKLINYVTK